MGLHKDPSGDPITGLPVNDSTNTFMIVFFNKIKNIVALDVCKQHHGEELCATLLLFMYFVPN
jgi:hypothetical protein